MSVIAGALVIVAYLTVPPQESEFINERWQCEIGSAARCIPLVADVNGDGSLEILVTTRFNGALTVVDSSGQIVRTEQRDQWLEGCLATSRYRRGLAAQVFFQESTGTVVTMLPDGSLATVAVPGEPRIGTAPCVIDLDGDGVQEIVCARRDGIVTALSPQLRPLWRFDTGSSIDSSPVSADVFRPLAAVFVQTVDGSVHCIDGRGWPRWRFSPLFESAAFPAHADLLVADFGEGSVVLASDKEGWLYVIDAASGVERWRIDTGNGAVGAPIILDIAPETGLEVVVVNDRGEITVLTAEGTALAQSRLPEGAYIPRPLAADVDRDGDPELLIARSDWRICVASLMGEIKSEIPIRGNVREGLVMADIDNDGRLELLAATDAASLHCFSTPASAGWTHPRGDSTFSAEATPVIRPAATPILARPPRAAIPKIQLISDLRRADPFATAVVSLVVPPHASTALLAIYQSGRLSGATVKPLESGTLTVPCVRTGSGRLTIETRLYDASGTLLGGSSGIPIGNSALRAVSLTDPARLVKALRERGDSYRVPDCWAIPKVAGANSWHVARYQPDVWRQYGLFAEPFIAEAAPRVWAPASSASQVLSSGEVVWSDLVADDKPFFVMNDYFWPEKTFPAELYARIVKEAGDRFLGFPVHEWAYRIWKTDLEGGTSRPVNRSAATEILRARFQDAIDKSHGQIYAGEGYCLFHHHAFEWGAPMAYAEVGENIPAAPIQFAFMRGASRQYGGRPWGVYVSNWFRGTVADTRYRAESQALKWGPDEYADGPNCGHSPSLEFRLEMAGHLSGATFIHHESDAHHGSIFVSEPQPGVYTLSPFGEAMRSWHAYATANPDRGIPYTPIAFMVNWDHGWRPREFIYGIWPQERPDRAMEALFSHVYAWAGRLDFERGYLTDSPYGDSFDVVTNTAERDVLEAYGVLWPAGFVDMNPTVQENVMSFVDQGGILVLDSALALQFPPRFIGARLSEGLHYATTVQTAIAPVPAAASPFRYRALRPFQSSETLAWTESGAPLVIWRRHGKGLVIVAATDHWTDEDDNLLPIAPMLLRQLTETFLPVTPCAGVETIINRTTRGWTIGLINNNGVRKTPTLPAQIDPGASRQCVLRFRRQPMRFKSLMGSFRWSNYSGGLTTTLEPGGVAVVNVELGES